MKVIILLLLLVSLVALVHAYFNHERLNSKYCIFVQNLQLILLPIAIYEVFSAPTISRNSLGEQEQIFSTGYYMILVIFIFLASAILVLRAWIFATDKLPKAFASVRGLPHRWNEAVIRKINKLFQ